MAEISVRAPATVSNVVCGFDCLGFALSEPFDEMKVRQIETREVKIVIRDDFGLSADPGKNVVGAALSAMILLGELDNGFEVEVKKYIKPGSGIGSSAASSCGAVVAANKLLGEPFSTEQLVEFAMEGERLASGARHADNVAPCIYGGFVLVRSIDPVDIIKLEHPPMWAAVLHPQIEIKTAKARAMLPTQVPLKHAVKNWSNLGAFVHALSKDDFELMKRAMEDHIVEPVRKSLIPHFDEVMEAGRGAGGIGGGISGSGPSMFMLYRNRQAAVEGETAMSRTFNKSGIEYRRFISRVEPNGVRIV